jgi:hypothetical protein
VALSAIGFTVGRTTFQSRIFSNRVAASLEEPGVAAFVADRITNEVLRQSPDLTAVRPLILVTVRELVTLEAMASLVRTAARTAHETVFSEGTRRVVMSVPDVGVLLRSALERVSPDIAARLPDDFHTRVASLGDGPFTRSIVTLWQLRNTAIVAFWSLLMLGIALLVTGGWLARDRRHGLVGVGVVLLGSSLAVVALLPLGRLALENAVADPLTRGAAQGLWRTGLSGLLGWGFLLGATGIALGAAGSSLLEDMPLTDWARRMWPRLTTPPDSRTGRAVWGLGVATAGAVMVWQPVEVLKGITVVTGLVLALSGGNQFFRVVLRSMAETGAVSPTHGVGRSFLRVAIAMTVLISGTAIFFMVRSPSVTPLTVAGCNGHRALCDRPVNAVVFPGSHNAMSNAEIADWMFPHHQSTIANQLHHGVRALLLDVHYGFPGASRIKTDLGGMRPTMDVLEQVVGTEGVEAAMRIRETLVGVDEGNRGLYLCHGFCEVGAYELTATLEEVRDFLVLRPDAVLVIVIEDYVMPEDLAAAFEDSRLIDFVYQGPSGPPWPSLASLVSTGHRVVVFLESGSPGVSWLRPAFEHIQETPYHFESPDDFSCRPHRGETAGSLFQINHWIETTPAPRPSNAEVVNAFEALMGRAQQCRDERGMLPNILAVDFYRTGDLLRVADALNGIARNGAPTN